MLFFWAIKAAFEPVSIRNGKLQNLQTANCSHTALLQEPRITMVLCPFLICRIWCRTRAITGACKVKSYSAGLIFLFGDVHHVLMISWYVYLLSKGSCSLFAAQSRNNKNYICRNSASHETKKTAGQPSNAHVHPCETVCSSPKSTFLKEIKKVIKPGHIHMYIFKSISISISISITISISISKSIYIYIYIATCLQQRSRSVFIRVGMRHPCFSSQTNTYIGRDMNCSLSCSTCAKKNWKICLFQNAELWVFTSIEIWFNHFPSQTKGKSDKRREHWTKLGP